MRPVPIPAHPTELTIDGKPFPAPITVSPLVQAIRYGFVWCPTDDLERCVVPDPAAALGSASEGRRYTELVDTIRDWNAQLPTRDSNAWLASKGGTAATAGHARSSGSPSRSSRSPCDGRAARPRCSCSVRIGALVLLVHALSQAPQSEFAAAVRAAVDRRRARGLLAPRRRPATARGVGSVERPAKRP